ncbi:PD-(D/E)XK nuclease family protein [Sulfurimonas sp.]|uniref:PD-(D/E)XK nuclease family protein n=1 Tax=Sulfurimonas sp. TaxID=2022749 RepID=UPI0026121CF2|nr:PD-(D/E)XK nuclease family protein [Sulfurimonas sp.]
MDNATIVLPSARAIRHEQLSLTDNGTIFLPTYMTMSDFITKLCIVKDYKYIDEDSRTLLLLEASDFKAFEALQIERNFFTFTKNSSYIFKFYEELSAELYDIANLHQADVYAEYDEHITILQELYKRYEQLCREKKLLDKIFLPNLYEFNEAFAKNHHTIELHLDGHLTNFELELLEKVTAFSKLTIIFSTTRFNQKMQDKFTALGFELEIGYVYRLDFNAKTVLCKDKLKKDAKISCESFSETLLQVAFIKQKIAAFVKEGYQAQNIAVILPNETIATTIKSFDEKCNLNFAMGESFKSSQLYTKLNATLKAIDQDSKENEARVNRVGEELFILLYGIYYKNASEIDFIAKMQECISYFSNKQEKKIFDEELFKFERLLPFMKEMSVKSLLNVFLQRLTARTIDDVRGGKVTVMGVLETRSIHFDAVIIIDFDDNNVPKRSDKDMFLNTKIREIASLPTMSDRENLQKHYYEMLMNNAKAVAISYVNSSQSKESRFLKQLGITEHNIHNELDFAELLFETSTIQALEEKEILQEYSFKNLELSATRLKTFLTCKRKYYYKYVQNIKNHEIPKDMPQEYEIGNVVHNALKSVYEKKNTYDDVNELKRDIDNALDEQCGESELDKYLVAMQKKRLDAFAHNEIQRFKQGWRVVATEEYFKTPFCGITIAGQIDRIDKKENLVEVLDYKTGSYTLNTKNNFMDATDFQLEFYYLLAAGLGNVEQCAFYDLKESKIVPESFLGEKIEILQSHIKDLLNIEAVNFEKCEDSKPCIYCEYATICGRD